MKTNYTLAIAMFLSVLGSAQNLEKRSLFSISTSTVAKGSADYSSSVLYSDVFLIPFQLKGVDESQFDQYTRVNPDVKGYSVDVMYQYMFANLFLLQFDAGYSNTQLANTQTGPIEFDPSTPPLLISDQFGAVYFGMGFGFDVMSDPDNAFQFIGTIGYKHYNRFLEAELLDLSREQPIESWNLYMNGFQYALNVRYNHTFESGFGVTLAMVFRNHQFNGAYKAEREELSIGDYELKDNTEVYWELPNSEESIHPLFNDTPQKLVTTELQFGVYYTF